jgi:hypothetical protein
MNKNINIHNQYYVQRYTCVNYALRHEDVWTRVVSFTPRQLHLRGKPPEPIA